MTLTEAFAGLQDPHTGPARRHDLREMILMALCAVLCGADTWVDAADWAEDNETWLRRYLVLERGTPSHDTFGRVFRIREIKGKTSTERAFYIDSKGIANAETFAKAARSHWGIENKLHWVLDVTFREDDCRVRKGHAPQNLSALRKFALTLLRQDQHYPKRSLRSRRKTADRIPDYRASLLGLAPLG